MTGADTPRITVRQYGDTASIRSLIRRQPDNTEFLLCWKGKYIVGITNVPAEQHFDVRYEYDNSAVIAHDFFADDPYPGVLTIEASESSDTTPVADFETELRAFLQTVGVGNVALSHVARLDWWNTKAAFYEVPVFTITSLEDADERRALALESNGEYYIPYLRYNGNLCYVLSNYSGQIQFVFGPQCPLTLALISEKLGNAAIPQQHTVVEYEFRQTSCNTQSGADFDIIPVGGGGYPTLHYKGLWYNDNLYGMFYLDEVKVITSGSLPESIEVGSTVVSLVNGTPIAITRVDNDNLTMSPLVLSEGAPAYANLIIDESLMVSSTVVEWMDTTEPGYWDGFIGELQDRYSVESVNVVNVQDITIDDCTCWTEY